MAVAFTLARPLLPSFVASSSSSIASWGVTLPFRPPLQSVVSAAVSSSTHHTLAVSGGDFTWNDVVNLSPAQQHDSSDLRGFFDKVALCNRNSERVCEFMPFVVEEQVLGYVHNGFWG